MLYQWPAQRTTARCDHIRSRREGYAFNATDLGRSHLGGSINLDMAAAGMGQVPSFLLPASLTDLVPAWKSRSVLSMGLARDPPQVLKPAKNMAPKATSHPAVPTSAQSVPYPQSMPKLPGPDPISSSLATEDRPSPAPKVAAASLGKLPSVCPPVGHAATHEIQQGLGAQVLSQGMKQLVPLTGRPAASYYSWVYTWCLELDGEALVLQVRPVAATNSHMALPKRRYKKRTHSSTMTGLPFPQIFPETRASPEQGGKHSSSRAPRAVGNLSIYAQFSFSKSWDRFAKRTAAAFCPSRITWPDLCGK